MQQLSSIPVVSSGNAGRPLVFGRTNIEESFKSGKFIFETAQTITQVRCNTDRTPDVPVHLMLLKTSGVTTSNVADFKFSASSAIYDVNPDVSVVVDDILQLVKDNNIVPKLTSNSSASPILASSSDANVNAYKAFDHDDATTFSISGSTGSVTVDFGSGTTNIVKAFSMTIGSVANDSPNAFKLQYSVSDGNTWVDAATLTGVTWNANERKYFYTNNSSGARYWRVSWTAGNGGSQVTLNDVAFMLGLDGLNDLTVQVSVG